MILVTKEQKLKIPARKNIWKRYINDCSKQANNDEWAIKKTRDPDQYDHVILM